MVTNTYNLIRGIIIRMHDVAFLASTCSNYVLQKFICFLHHMTEVWNMRARTTQHTNRYQTLKGFHVN